MLLNYQSYVRGTIFIVRSLGRYMSISRASKVRSMRWIFDPWQRHKCEFYQGREGHKNSKTSTRHLREVNEVNHDSTSIRKSGGRNKNLISYSLKISAQHCSYHSSLHRVNLETLQTAKRRNVQREGRIYEYVNTQFFIFWICVYDNLFSSHFHGYMQKLHTYIHGSSVLPDC